MNLKMNKLIRITTVPISLETLLEGQLKYMSKYYEVLAISSDEKHLKKIEQKDGVRTFCVEMTRQITPWKDFKALWKLYHLLRKEKPLFVHTHTPKAGAIGMMAAWLARVPNRLHTIAGLPLLEATGSKRQLLNFVEKLTYKCATYIYPNSFVLKNIIIKEKFCKSKKLKVIANGSSNGINTSYFNPYLFAYEQKEKLRQQLKIQKNDFVFIFVGRLVADKGINELIKAFTSVQIKQPKIKLLLVGTFENELDPLSKETVDVIKTNHNIISVGWQADVRPYFAISDALVFPSYREGFPNVVMQGGAMGLPAIVTDINGCNEIIVDGENGIIIPPKDEETLAKKMAFFISDKDLINRLKLNAREMIISRYEQQIVWNALLEEYQSLEKQYKENV